MHFPSLFLTFTAVFLAAVTSGRAIEVRVDESYPTFLPNSTLHQRKVELDAAIKVETDLVSKLYGGSYSQGTISAEDKQTLNDVVQKLLAAQEAFDKQVECDATPWQKLLIVKQQLRDAQDELKAAQQMVTSYQHGSKPPISPDRDPEAYVWNIDDYNHDLQGYQDRVTLYQSQLTQLNAKLAKLKKDHPELSAY